VVPGGVDREDDQSWVVEVLGTGTSRRVPRRALVRVRREVQPAARLTCRAAAEAVAAAWVPELVG
jgi:hypothetical protein